MNTKNRWIVKLGVGLFIAFNLLGCVQDKDLPTKPNIIYILADDLGYGDIGCYGQQVIKTPNIDQLAKEGIRFTQHYAGSTVCAPSRSALLTGLHTGHTFVRGNGQFQLREDKEDITIARLLKNAGYHTATIGKAGTGCNCDLGQPNRKGFDYFFGFLGHGAAHTYFPEYVYRNEEKILFPDNGGFKTWAGESYIHDVFLKEVLGYIEKHKEEPFFLHYASLLPHAQMYAPEEFKADYKGKFAEKRFEGKHYGTCEDPNATTAGMINRLDWEVGQIMKKLKELGLDKNTVVMFASDNGPHNVGGRDANFFKSSGPYRGIKRDLYEGGIRVPFIVRWPDVVKKGIVSNHISAFWDVMPTLLDVIGSDVEQKTDGISFYPTLKGEPQKEHSYLYWEFHERGKSQAVRQGKWKGVRTGIKEGNMKIELYNLDEDISETNNIAHLYPEVVKALEEIMDREHETSPIEKFHIPQIDNKDTEIALENN
ncbi:MAG: arylsulfatase [Carboxylicivirga sp.]|jgi:arylsulfatase A-like enzyme|nr:arylsulfatase [Carboxylicivirga sp.]